uniref:CNH domain-containing protein n=1 Tax=Panagrellus redivivus TaxID=6233 RepID=A0A7E4VQ83_PANRE
MRPLKVCARVRVKQVNAVVSIDHTLTAANSPLCPSFPVPESAMYDAYAKIEVMNVYDTTALVVHPTQNSIFTTQKNGALVHFERPKDSTRGYEPQAFRHFEKKTVHDLQFVERLGLLVCLANNQVTAHRASGDFGVVAVLDQYTPVGAFACRVREKDNMLFVVISARRQLHVFKLIKDKFDEVNIPFNPNQLYENSPLIRWASDWSIYFVNRTEFAFVQLFENPLQPVSSGIGQVRVITSRPANAPMLAIPEKELVGLAQGSTLKFFDGNGNPAKGINDAKYDDQPLQLCYDHPYVLAVLPRNVIEVRSLAPSMIVQAIPIDKCSFIAPGIPGSVFTLGGTSLYELRSRPMIKDNIRTLIKDMQFQLASELTDLCDTMTHKEKVDVKRKTAAFYFAQKQFPECFAIHKVLKTDILLLLCHFPDLIPEKYRSKVGKDATDFVPCPDFAYNDWKAAVNELSDFLTDIRTEHGKKVELHRKGEVRLSSSEFKSVENVLELAETVLLKCYIKYRPSMVSSLLRLDNNVNISEAQKDLNDAARFDDLYLLYSKKNHRREALEILAKQSKKEDSLYYGVEEAVSYLQTLGPNYFDLIKEHARWVLKEDPEYGVKIFATNETEAAKQLARDGVLKFLQAECVKAVIPYLEHAIFEWHDERPAFHDELVGMYVCKVRNNLKDYVHALGENEMIPRAGEEEGELGKYRTKLLNLLNSSDKYNAAKVETQLEDNMMNEKAIVYGRLGRHEEALLIYSHVLVDYELAEAHCDKYWKPKPLKSSGSTSKPSSYNSKADLKPSVDTSGIYITLFKAYTDPTLLSAYSTLKRINQSTKPKVSEALKLLARHPTQMDLTEALRLIPDKTELHKVWPALESVMESVKNKANALNIHLGLTQSTLQQKQVHLQALKSKKVQVDFNSYCCFCHRSVDGVFISFKDGRLAHYGCHMRDRGQAPAIAIQSQSLASGISRRERTFSALN